MELGQHLWWGHEQEMPCWIRAVTEEGIWGCRRAWPVGAPHIRAGNKAHGDGHGQEMCSLDSSLGDSQRMSAYQAQGGIQAHGDGRPLLWKL